MSEINCLFCNIAAKKTKTPFIYEDKEIVVFEDIAPKAPNHLLIIPKKHIATFNDVTDEDTQLIGHMMQIAKKEAQKLNIAKSGYRLLLNCNPDGGQVIYHLHLHLLGGRKLHWPPG